MKKLLIPVMLIAAAVALAACGSSGGDQATASSATGANAVSAKNIAGTGMVLVDSSGQALYASDQEAATGKIMCTGACNSFWQPVMAKGTPTASGSIQGQLGVVKRPDGGMQVTYKGEPLYTFTQDQAGEVTGDGFKDAFGGQQFTWHAVTVGGSSSQSSAGGASTGSGASSGGGGYSY